MQIREYVGSDKNPGVDSPLTADDQSMCSRDSCFFTSLLEKPTTAHTPITRPALSPMLTDVIHPLQTSRTRMGKLLRSTNKEVDIAEFRKLPGLLANIQVTSQMLVKCLAKTTQGIEKISNLQ